MSKRLKRLLSVVLTVVVCIGVGLVFKFGLHTKAAYIDPGTYGDFEYKQMPYRNYYDTEKRIEITKYNGNDSVVTIPDTIEGITVRSIGENAFKGNSTITEIVFTEKLQEIHVSAFENCSNLESVEFPHSLQSLYYNAFANCSNLVSVTIPNVSSNLGVPLKMSSTGSEHGYNEYTSVFEGCPNLNKVIIEDGIKIIPACLFQNCIGITSIEIPSSVETIQGGAFRGCSNLETVIFENNSNLKMLRGFEECTNLKSITIPDTVETIGGLANTGIESIVLPDSITRIDDCTFYDCANLNEISLPKNLESLGCMCFAGTGITSITLPKTLENTGCTSDGGPFARSNIKDIELEVGLEKIPDHCFASSQIESIDLPDTIKSIEYKAFSSCKIKEITIPKSVERIDYNNSYPYESALGYYQGSGALGNIKDVYGYVDSAADDYCAHVSGSYFHPIDPEVIKVVNESFKIQGSGEYKKEDNKGYYYSDSYFYKPATEYNPSLATMSLSLAFSTYGVKDGKKPDYENYDKNVYDILDKCGFCKDGRYEAFDYNTSPTKDSVACAIGSKEIPGGYTVIAVAVRSGGYGPEWANNFKIGTKNNHEGFEESAKKIKSDIESYLSKRNYKYTSVKVGKIKLWITGYSRGAAVATQAAAYISRNGLNSNYNSIDKKDIYAYGFATPAGVLKSSDIHSDRYNNIFNIIEYNDPVPLVAPAKFKFDRYGKTFVLPYKESATDDAFNNYIKTVSGRMGNSFKIDDFQNVSNLKAGSLGTYWRKFVDKIAFMMISRDWYNVFYQSYIMNTLEDVNEADFGNRIKGAKSLFKALVYILPALEIQYWDYLDVLTNNIDLLIDVHANPDYYLTWMQLMDPNYPGNMPVEWGHENYRAHTWDCPVDVYVYNSSNALVASIVDEKPVKINNSHIVSAIDENGSKVVYLPISENYRFEVVARENCEVTYNANEYTTTSGQQTRNVSYSAIPMEKGETVSGEVEAFSSEEIESGTEDGSSAVYSLLKNDEEIQATHDFDAEDISSNQYDVELEDADHGTLLGGGSFTDCSFAMITAVPDIGYNLENFYVDGEEFHDDDLDDNPLTVRFEVNKNTKVSATFKKAPGLFSSKGTELTSKSSTTLFYNDLDEDALNHTYKFIVHNKTTNQWYKLRDFDAESSIEWFTGVAGEKSLYVDIKDITTDTIVKRVELNVTVSDPTLNIDSFTINPGTTVAPSVSATLEANVSGGTGDYLYKFIVYNQNTKQWYKLRDFAPENTFDWFTGPEGEKTLYVDVKDASNDTIVKRAELSVTVSDPKLKVESFTIEPDGELATNTRAQLHAKATGGAGDYQYKFIVYNESTKQWYKLKDFGPESTYDWYTGPAGNKTLYVDVRDAEGTVVRKGLTVKVNE